MQGNEEEKLGNAQPEIRKSGDFWSGAEMSTGGRLGLGRGSQELFLSSYAYIYVHVIYTLWLVLL